MGVMLLAQENILRLVRLVKYIDLRVWMKNININVITQKLKRIALFFSILLAIFVLPYWVVLWISLDFNPDFLSIDSCMDSGGAWHEEKRACVGLNDSE